MRRPAPGEEGLNRQPWHVGRGSAPDRAVLALNCEQPLWTGNELPNAGAVSDRRVRPAVPADAERLGHIKVVTWRAAYRGLLPGKVLDDLSVTHFADQFRDRIHSMLAADTTAQTTLVLEEAAEVVGYGMAGPYRGDDLPQAGEIYALYVEPSAWGHGAGAELLAATESHLVRNGFDRAALWVLESNAAGQGFYRAMGWTDDGERADHCEIDQAPERRYQKNLTAGP